MIKIHKDLNLYIFFLLIFSFFIASPLIINLSLFVIGIISVYFFDIKLFKKKEIIIFLILILLILLTTMFSDMETMSKLYSLSWLKFFLLFIFLFQFTNEMNEKKFKKYSKFFLYFFYILILDIFLQRFLGYELFNNQLIEGRSTGPYTNKLIPGAIILFVGFLPFFFKIQEYVSKNKFIKATIISNIFFISIFITGERMNTLMSFFAILLITLILFRYKKFLISFLIIYILSIFLILNNYEYDGNKYFASRFNDFLKYSKLSTKSMNKSENSESLNLTSSSIDNISDNEISIKKNEKSIFDNPWGAHYLTAFEIWKDHLFFGAGNKSFRYNCVNYNYIKSSKKNVRCSTHPHNIYLEILSEFGLIGFILFISLNLMILYKSLKYLKSCYKYKLINNFNIRLLISVFIIFILLIWPIKSTGRISSTFYGTIYWFYVFFLCTLNYKLKKILTNFKIK